MTITTGRSGTTFLHNVFRRTYPEQRGIFHESLHPGSAKPAMYQRLADRTALDDPEVAAHLAQWDELLQVGPVADFGWVLGWLAPALVQHYRERLKVLILTAHPLSVAASFANRGHYTLNRSHLWAISPHHERVVHGARYAARWSGMSAYEKGLYRWLETTQFGIDFRRDFPEVEVMEALSQDIFAKPQIIERIADTIGFPSRPLDLRVDKNETSRQHAERRPVGEEWKRIYDMPEVVELAQGLGFDMSESTLAKMVGRYRPQGVLPNLRHLTGYWAAREKLGRWRRNLRPKNDT